MNFQEAYGYLKNGRDIAMPEWGGFWRWDALGKTIQIHLRTGEVMDFRESPDLDFTLGFTLRDDWVLVDAASTEHAANAS